MNREAIILAGGLGSRLKSVVSDRPKPMALIGGRPFLLYLLKYLEKNGFSHVVLAVGYKHEMVFDFFGTKFGSLEIAYAIEDEPLGTGGAILNALRFSKSGQCFILNGDTYFQVSFDEMENIAEKNRCELVMAVRQLDDISRYGSLSIGNDGRVIGFVEKKDEPVPGIINGGVYWLDKTLFLQHNLPPVFSFENNYLTKFYASSGFYAMVSQGYFIDIGIPESYHQAQADFFNFSE